MGPDGSHEHESHGDLEEQERPAVQEARQIVGNVLEEEQRDYIQETQEVVDTAESLVGYSRAFHEQALAEYRHIFDEMNNQHRLSALRDRPELSLGAFEGKNPPTPAELKHNSSKLFEAKLTSIYADRFLNDPTRNYTGDKSWLERTIFTYLSHKALLAHELNKRPAPDVSQQEIEHAKQLEDQHVANLEKLLGPIAAHEIEEIRKLYIYILNGGEFDENNGVTPKDFLDLRERAHKIQDHYTILHPSEEEPPRPKKGELAKPIYYAGREMPEDLIDAVIEVGLGSERIG